MLKILDSAIALWLIKKLVRIIYQVYPTIISCFRLAESFQPNNIKDVFVHDIFPSVIYLTALVARSHLMQNVTKTLHKCHVNVNSFKGTNIMGVKEKKYMPGSILNSFLTGGMYIHAMGYV